MFWQIEHRRLNTKPQSYCLACSVEIFRLKVLTAHDIPVFRWPLLLPSHQIAPSCPSLWVFWEAISISHYISPNYSLNTKHNITLHYKHLQTFCNIFLVLPAVGFICDEQLLRLININTMFGRQMKKITRQNCNIAVCRPMTYSKNSIWSSH